MEKEKAIYNELPVITFRWLKANHINLYPNEDNGTKFNSDYVINGKEFILDKEAFDAKNFLFDYKGTNEIELNRVVNNPNVINNIESKSSDNEVMRFKFDLNKDNNILMERNIIKIKKNEKLTLVEEYISDENAIEASTLNLIEVEEGGELTLIKVNHLHENTRHIDQRHAQVHKTGKVTYISVDLGGKESLINYVTNLKGDESEAYLKSIYIGDKERLIDLSHVINHYGLKCNSDMEIRGALKDKAKKYFRGTLDFKTGSTQSEGGEVETVMLLNKNVRSFAIPLLLCTEDDVIGNHAASAGQIDEDKLFYLMSRGFSEIESKKIIVESAFRPIIDLLEFDDLKENIINQVETMMKRVD